jgi:hypothetical protein
LTERPNGRLTALGGGDGREGVEPSSPQLESLEISAGIAPWTKPSILELPGNPLRGALEFRAWRLPSARRVVGKGAQLGAEIGCRDGLDGKLDHRIGSRLFRGGILSLRGQ